MFCLQHYDKIYPFFFIVQSETIVLALLSVAKLAISLVAEILQLILLQNPLQSVAL